MQVTDIILLTVLIVSVSSTVIFSDTIAAVFNKKELNLFQLYAVSAAAGVIAVTSISIIISLLGGSATATKLVADHFSHSFIEELIVWVLSPLLKCIPLSRY